MTPNPTSADPTQGQAPDPASYYRFLIHGLLDQGANLARMVHDHAQAQFEAPAPGAEPACPTPDTVASFDRLSRCVRRGILLARSLDQPPRAPASAHGPDRTAARKRIIRAIEDDIHWISPDRPEALHAELLDRLDAPDLDDEIAGRPVKDIILDIRRDLGLENIPGMDPYKRRTPADLATLHARAASPAQEPPRANASARQAAASIRLRDSS